MSDEEMKDLIAMGDAMDALRARVKELEMALCKISTATRRDTSLRPSDGLLEFIVATVDAALAQARTDERDQCAKVVESEKLEDPQDCEDRAYDLACDHIAAAIRAFKE